MSPISFPTTSAARAGTSGVVHPMVAQLILPIVQQVVGQSRQTPWRNLPGLVRALLWPIVQQAVAQFGTHATPRRRPVYKANWSAKTPPFVETRAINPVPAGQSPSRPSLPAAVDPESAVRCPNRAPAIPGWHGLCQ